MGKGKMFHRTFCSQRSEGGRSACGLSIKTCKNKKMFHWFLLGVGDVDGSSWLQRKDGPGFNMYIQGRMRKEDDEFF